MTNTKRADSVILATCEAEIKRIMVPGQSRQKFNKTLSQQIATTVVNTQAFRYMGGLWFQVSLGKKDCEIVSHKLGLVMCACHSSDHGTHKTVLWSRLTWTKSKTLSPNNQSKKGWKHGSSSRVTAFQL
jgi:hypothetical protein